MICRICNKDKDIEMFCSHGSYCKQCDAERARAYRKTPKGLVSQIYNDQVKTCKKRGRELPKYSQTELFGWITHHPKFEIMMKEWKKSNFDKNLTPSVDRIDEYKTYCFNNIQLITWMENNQKAYMYRRKGLNNKQSRKVGKVVNGVVVEEYHSVNDAGRQNKCRASHISEVAHGKRKQAGGRQWVFLSDVGHKNNRGVV